jgi:putative transcriptional regulator
MRAGRRTSIWSLAGLLIFGLAPFPLLAQSTNTRDLAAGKLLVASRDLGDPNFAETVVVLVRHDKDDVVGLVVNRRTKVPISRALEDLKGAKGRSDLVYAGGPVGRTGVLALVRSRAKMEEAERVFGEVYLITTAVTLEKAMAAEAQPDTFHVYVGYAGWTAKQLAAEVELGAWYIFSGDASIVFAANPESVWSRLIKRTEENVAFSRRMTLRFARY